MPPSTDEGSSTTPALEASAFMSTFESGRSSDYLDEEKLDGIKPDQALSFICGAK